MPDAYMRNQRAEEYSRQLAERDPITKRPANGGLKFTNDSSPDNPFNVTAGGRYQEFEDRNKKIVENDSYAKFAQRGAGGGIQPGNQSSMDNPLNNYSQEYLDYHKNRNQGYSDYHKGLRQNKGGGIQPGNHTSAESTLPGAGAYGNNQRYA